jgi:hypothetical protein
MTLQDTSQTKRKYRLAALVEWMKKNNMDPENHRPDYNNGWYFVNGEGRQLPEVTLRAKVQRRRNRFQVAHCTESERYVFAMPSEVNPDPKRTPQKNPVRK